MPDRFDEKAVEEMARGLVLDYFGPEFAHQHVELRTCIRMAITAAVEAEREACARVCDNERERVKRTGMGDLVTEDSLRKAAAAIRARGGCDA